ncbi:succinate dehydrogenase [Sulfurifustis variabilis]|uniref:Succinate dehydrogenase cytochrome b556 subunit n=1 Tax=Sulfurifustis variabilis TaxID=1675686 RepID=A0A1B4V4F1_9GAMM|nr:succinate dehydrogenase, cytochrome b556 subunit [Sulfurifustis variabilis]BAU48406.1 succinate dehydrogenase [Sulfurifustis variabilis]
MSDWRARNHPAWWAFLVHRLSGLLLAAFLPLHFWALAQALRGAERLDGFLRWTEQPVVKLAEVGLVLLLAAHLTGGLRLLMLEFLAWREWQKGLLAAAAGTSLAAALVFALNVV